MIQILENPGSTLITMGSITYKLINIHSVSSTIRFTVILRRGYKTPSKIIQNVNDDVRHSVETLKQQPGGA